MHRRYLVWKYYSGTRRKILRNSVKVQDFSFALFEFFPSRKLEVTEHDHMRLTLRAMFIECASTDCNMAKVVTFDNPTNIILMTNLECYQLLLNEGIVQDTLKDQVNEMIR